jgi:hypothetical protein
MQELDLRQVRRMSEPLLQRAPAAPTPAASAPRVTPAPASRVQREDMPVVKPQDSKAPATTGAKPAAPSTGGGKPATKPQQPDGPDLHDLARKVYPMIRRMLAIERERR